MVGDYYTPEKFEQKLEAFVGDTLKRAMRSNADSAILVKWMETPQYRAAMRKMSIFSSCLPAQNLRKKLCASFILFEN